MNKYDTNHAGSNTKKTHNRILCMQYVYILYNEQKESLVSFIACNELEIRCHSGEFDISHWNIPNTESNQNEVH